MSVAFRHQLLGTICANILAIGFGTVIGWPSASVMILLSDQTPLPTGPLNIEEISWIGSLICFGAFFGNIICAWSSNRYGRKIPLMGIAVPQIIGWLLIIFAVNPACLYAARFLLGMSGGGVYVIIPPYIAEISDNNVRGTLGSLFVFSINIGILLAYVLGYFFSYMVSPIILTFIPVLFLISFVFLPETPQFLLRTGQEKKAKASLRFYKNLKSQSTEEVDLVKKEIENIKTVSSSEDKTNSTNEQIVTWRNFTTPVALRALMIGLGFLVLKQFCGHYVLIMYAGKIFTDAGSEITPNLAAILIGTIQLIGTYIPTLLVDRAGRRVLLIFSAIGSGIGYSVLGAYMYAKTDGYELDGYGWIPLASMAFVLFIGNCGLIPLPFLIIAEIMPQEIRATGLSFCMSALWVFAFISVKIFPPLVLVLQLHGCMFFFAVFTIVYTIFVVIFVPETKGKSFDEISRLMKGPLIQCCRSDRLNRNVS